MKISYNTHENHFRIKYKNVISVYYLHQVKELSISKRRDLRLNNMLMCSAILSFAIAMYIDEIFEPVRILSFLCSGFFFIFSLMHRAHDYDLVLELNDNRIVKLKVNTLNLEDVKQSLYLINKVMNNDDDNYSFAYNEMIEATALKLKSFD